MKKTVGLTLLSLACLSTSCFAETALDQNARLLNTVLNRFEAVSCDKTATQCVAIGFGAEYHMYDRFAYMSQDGGLTWSEPVLLASPKEEITSALNDSQNPANIDCDEFGQQCIFTSSAIIEKVPTPIVYATKDGGLTWSAPKTLPLPKGVNKTQKYTNDSLSTDISCDQTNTVCTIAGSLVGDREATPLIYSTDNAGETWKFNALKQPSYQAPGSIYHGTFIAGVSCNFSGLNCVVVGNSVISTSFFSDYYSSHPISYHTQDGGNHWSKPFVLDTKETNDDDRASTLVDVACDNAGMHCTAIGYIENFNSFDFLPFALTTRNGGADWESISAIIPQAGQYFLRSVDCDNSGVYCVAVGEEHKKINTISVVKPIIYTTKNAGALWEKNMDKAFPNSSVLNDVFCNISSERCLAVGSQVGTNNPLAAKQIKNLFSLHKFRVPDFLQHRQN